MRSSGALRSLERPTYQSNLQGGPLKIGPIGWPEMSEENHSSTLRKIPKARRFLHQVVSALVASVDVYDLVRCVLYRGL